MNLDELRNKEWKMGDWIMINRLQWGKPEVDQIIAVLESDWFGGASVFNTKFEDAIKRFIGAKFVQSTNSGSSAIEIAIQVLIQTGKIKAGDKVLHPALTFPTSISSAIMAGLIPVYCDVDVNTCVASSDSIRQAFQEHPDIKLALIPLLIGNIPDLDLIKELLGEDGILLIDSCDTIGSQWREKDAVTFGQMGFLSFYGSHHISTFGVGGGICTNDDIYADLIKSLTFWGRDFEVEKGDRLTSFLKRYSYKTIGFDAQMSAVQASFGIAQVERLAEYIGQRATIFRKLQQTFVKYKDFIHQPQRVSDKADVSWFAYPLVIKKDSPFSREDMVNFLLDNKIEIRPVMCLLPDQKVYQESFHYKVGDWKGATEIQNRGVFLPACPMGSEQQEYYLDTIKRFLEKYG